ncbi:MAG: RNA polymerase sigma factor RpoD/SigA [Opitutales bacterium]|nr:RNA polymerase sigma factor RpoD/SigA [Opitutales bacterium]
MSTVTATRNRHTEIRVNRGTAPSFDETVEDVRNLPASEKSAIKIYLQEIGKTPLLKPSEEVELAALIQSGDRRAREKMIKANLRLVVKIAHDYANFGLPLLDLISEGNIGLIKAVERFDPQKGGKLSTYAAWWIKQSIKRALANQSKTIRLPVHMVDKIARIRRTANELEEELGRAPTDDELAHVLGMSVNKIAHLKSVSVRPTSLDAPVGEDESTHFGDLIGDENSISPFDSLQDKNLLNELNRMLDQLDPREAEIIRLRFGLNGHTPKTLEEVGDMFNVTRERVRQLQNIALTRMRRALTEKERQRSKEEIREERIQQERMAVMREFYETNVAASKDAN